MDTATTLAGSGVLPKLGWWHVKGMTRPGRDAIGRGHRISDFIGGMASSRRVAASRVLPVSCQSARCAKGIADLPAPIPEVGRGLSDALKIGPHLRVRIKVTLHLFALSFSRLALEAGKECVHVGMGEQVGRRGRRNTGHDARQISGGAVRRRLGHCR
jgi:hypothetical protein